MRLICMLMVRRSMARSLVVALLKSRSAAGSLFSSFIAEANMLVTDSLVASMFARLGPLESVPITLGILLLSC